MNVKENKSYLIALMNVQKNSFFFFSKTDITDSHICLREY